MATQPSPAPPAALLPTPCRVRAVRAESVDTWTLELEAPPDYAFAPGQFDMVYAFGVGEVPISHSGDPGKPEVLFHTIRAVGAVTRALCSVRPGHVLGIRGPFGTAWPVAEAKGRDLVFVAGGIGLAPLRPAIYAALAERRSYGRIVLVVGTRSPLDRLFVGEMAEWVRRKDVEVHQTVDAAHGDWNGHVGVVTQLLPRIPFDAPRTTAFICGPEIMMRFTANELIDEDVDPGDIYISMERNMKCAVGTCGHCQLAGSFVCKDGPVYAYPAMKDLMLVREL